MCTYLQAHNYAVAGRELPTTKRDTHLGYVLRGCGEKLEHTTLLPVNIKNRNQWTPTEFKVFFGIYLAGIVFQLILFLFFCKLILHSKLEAIANATRAPSHKSYGLFWGCATVSFVGNICIAANSIAIIHTCIAAGVKNEGKLLVAAGSAQAVFQGITLIVLFGMAVFYGRRVNIPTPAVYQWIMHILLCCQKVMARKAMQVLALWNMSIFLAYTLGHADFVLLAFFAQPARVISASVGYVFAIFCCVHLLAAIFMLSKPQNLSGHRSALSAFLSTLVQAVMFTVLFAAALCFGLVICAAGVVAYESHQGSPFPILSIVTTPILVVFVGWVLRKVAARWLAMHQPQGNCHQAVNQVPLPSPGRERDRTRGIIDFVSSLTSSMQPGASGFGSLQYEQI